MYHRIRACWDLGIHSRNVELLCTPKRIFSSTLPVPRPVKTKSSVYVFSGSNKDTVSDVCLIIRLFFVTIMQYQAKDITVIKNMFVAWHENPNNGYTSTQISAVSANMKVSWTYCHISLKNFRSPLILSLHVIQSDSVILTSELRGSHTICCRIFLSFWTLFIVLLESVCGFRFIIKQTEFEVIRCFPDFLRNALQKQTVAEPLKTWSVHTVFCVPALHGRVSILDVLSSSSPCK